MVVILLVGGSGQQFCLWGAPGSNPACGEPPWSEFCLWGALCEPPRPVHPFLLRAASQRALAHKRGPKVSALRRPRQKPTRGLLSNSDKSLQMCSLQWAATGGSQGGPRTPALYVLLGTRGAGGLLLQARAGRCCGRPGTRTHTAAHSVQVAQKVLVEPTS